MTKDRKLIIILEDVQWADGGSVSLLHSLEKKVQFLGVMIVCTYGPKEILASGMCAVHPVDQAMPDMRKERLCEEKVLGPLSGTELGQLAAGVLGHPFERTGLYRLLEFTGFNTRFFIDTLRPMTSASAIMTMTCGRSRPGRPRP